MAQIRKNTKSKSKISKSNSKKSKLNFKLSDSQKTNYIYYTISVVAIICLIFSILVLNEKRYYETGEKGLCTIITEGNNCQIVQTSKYAQIFGFKNPYLGIFGFSILALAAALYPKYQNKWLRLIVLSAGVVSGSLAIYFLYVQAFILNLYCLFCVIVDIFSIMLFATSIYLFFKNK